MDKRVPKALGGAGQVGRFLDDNADALAFINDGGARAAFDDAVQRLAAAARAQDTHTMGAIGGTAGEAEAARVLRRGHIVPAVKMAVKKVPAAAELSGVFVPPHGTSRAALTVHARALAIALEPFRQVLAENGLPADFIERLRAAAGALDEAMNVRQAHVRNRQQATSGVALQVEELRAELQVMDALVRSVIGDRDARLAQWKGIVRYVRRALSRGPADAGEPVPALALAGAPATSGPQVGAAAPVPAAITSAISEVKAA